MTMLSHAKTTRSTIVPGDRVGALVIVGRSMGALAVVLALYGLVTLIVIGRADVIANDWVLHAGGWAIGFGVLGWLALPNQPHNKAAWVTVVAALFAGLATAAWGTMPLLGQSVGLDMSVDGDPSQGLYSLSPAQLPVLAAICWMIVFAAVLPGFFLVITLGFLLFPDGEPLSPRWRWVVWTAVVLIPVLGLAIAWEWRPGSTLPYNAGSDDFTGIGRLANFLMPAIVVLVALSVASLVIRYRHSRDVLRQQHKWIALGATIFFVVLALVALTQNPVPEWTEQGGWRRWSFFLAGLALISSYGVAVTRYRLYDIDLVINRAVVFALLAGFITLVYALLVVALGHLIGRGESLVLPIIATAVVAVAFEPVRQRAQRWANRVVYGRKASPYEVLSDLTTRLAASEEGVGILARIAKLIHDGTGAQRATVWLGQSSEMKPAATWPPENSLGDAPLLDADGIFPVHHDGEVVGALEVVKPRGSVITGQERELVMDVAGSAGLVFGYQRLNDSLAKSAREVQESRARLVGIQDEERRRLEIDLRDGVQQHIASLLARITAAEKIAAEEGAAQVEGLLGSLEVEARAALDEVGSLAKGIYPPILVSDGLISAVAALAAGSPVEVTLEHSELGRYPLETEAAVYFNVSEAITNAVKHAQPPIRAALIESDGVLRFTVIDSGPGFDVDHAVGGSGLNNMTDRMDSVGGHLHVSSRPGGVTNVSGEIPIGR